LNLLGTVFGWVATDVYNKMETVRGHRKGDQSTKYETVQTMLAHEIETNMIKPKARDSTVSKPSQSSLKQLFLVQKQNAVIMLLIFPPLKTLE